MSKKKSFVNACFILLGCTLLLMACGDKKHVNSKPELTPEPTTDTALQDTKVNITIGNKSFTATLYDNATTQAFIELLPITLDMKEMNGNEKFNFMEESMPTEERQPEQITTGDIMLYGSDCLVLFYQTFQTSYRYTSLGYITNPEELRNAVGTGDIAVTFSLDS